MNRDILKILLGGLLILLLGILGFYIVLKGDQISQWIKQRQGNPVEESLSKDPEILSMDKVQNSKGEFPSSQNFDSEPVKSKERETVSEPSSQNVPKTDYEMPGLGEEKKESKSKSQPDTRDSSDVVSKKEKFPSEDFSTPKSKAKEDRIEYDDVPKNKKSKLHSKHKSGKAKKSGNLNRRLSSLEKRVVRLEKKLGVKSEKTRKAKNRKKLPLAKRVEILEKEVSGLKKNRTE